MKNVALVVAIILGVVAAIGVRMWLKRQKREVVDQLKPVRVAVARASIKKGEQLTPDKVGYEERPIASLNQASIPYSRIKNYYGRSVWRDVDRGTELQATFFIEPTSLPASRGLQEGERAVTISVDATSGVAGLLRPTDRVDIIATITSEGDPTKARAERVKTVRVLSDVMVLAVDNRMSTGVPGARTNAYRGTYTTVTLAVTPLEGQVLVYLRARAQLTLVLRPRFETGQSTTMQDIDINNVLGFAQQANEARQKRLKERKKEARPILPEE